MATVYTQPDGCHGPFVDLLICLLVNARGRVPWVAQLSWRGSGENSSRGSEKRVDNLLVGNEELHKGHK